MWVRAQRPLPALWMPPLELVVNQAWEDNGACAREASCPSDACADLIQVREPAVDDLDEEGIDATQLAASQGAARCFGHAVALARQELRKNDAGFAEVVLTAALQMLGIDGWLVPTARLVPPSRAVAGALLSQLVPPDLPGDSRALLTYTRSMLAYRTSVLDHQGDVNATLRAAEHDAMASAEAVTDLSMKWTMTMVAYKLRWHRVVVQSRAAQQESELRAAINNCLAVLTTLDGVAEFGAVQSTWHAWLYRSFSGLAAANTLLLPEDDELRRRLPTAKAAFLQEAVHRGALCHEQQFPMGDYFPRLCARPRRSWGWTRQHVPARPWIEGTEHHTLKRVRDTLKRAHQSIVTEVLRLKDENLTAYERLWAVNEPALQDMSRRGEWFHLRLIHDGRPQLGKELLECLSQTSAALKTIHHILPISLASFIYLHENQSVASHVGKHSVAVRHVLTLESGCAPQPVSATRTCGRLRVAGEERPYVEGDVLSFDDSFIHDVHHGGVDGRFVLIVETVNPLVICADNVYSSAWQPFEVQLNEWHRGICGVGR